jgi:hypothetical protein
VAKKTHNGARPLVLTKFKGGIRHCQWYLVLGIAVVPTARGQ